MNTKTKYCLPLIISLSVMMFGVANASVIYVNGNAAGANNGTSWASAFTNLETALSSASPGSEIWVAQGIYFPTNISDSFQLRTSVAMYGGFSGTETIRTQRNWNLNVTVLSGNIGSPGDPIDNCYHVLIGANGAVLDGFTVTGGNAVGAYPCLDGGGILNSNTSPVIANCRFAGNSAQFDCGSGGAIFNLNSSSEISNCVFAGNSAYWGGAICNLGGAPTITGCTFQTNNADFGGGIDNEHTAVAVQNCVFIRNSGDGGGINNRGCAPTILNCVFSGNNSPLWDGGGLGNVGAAGSIENSVFVGNVSPMGSGGGVFNFLASPNLINCTFFQNTSSIGNGGGMYSGNSTNVVVKNCIIWGDFAGLGSGEIFNSNSLPYFTACDIQGGLNGPECGGALSGNGGSNLASDPRFVNSGNPAGPDGIFGTADDGLELDMQLTFTSPCIDSGISNGAPAFDLVGLARPQILGVDIGAYEYNPDFDGDGLPNLLEYELGSNAHSPDSNGDGLSDHDAYFIYGINPATLNTGDGIPVAWAVQHGMNPLVNEANNQIGSTGVTYWQIYQYDLTHTNQLDPRNPFFASGTSIYEILNNGQHTNRFYYDNENRLVGMESSRGISIAYTYDGNGNIVRQTFLSRADEGTNGLPVLWRFLNGLTNSANSSAYAAFNGNPRSNYQEWIAGTNLLNTNSVIGTNVVETAPLAIVLP